ncbi:MAG: hypothetical protein GX811_03985, partial [Lentisphaerae bacterium]|nr:hypothetical protein [Lentisphaerota bacterium]
TVEIEDDVLPCAINLGYSPTVEDFEQYLRLEVHLIDFNADLYGQRLEVSFCEKIRDELKFENLDELRKQMQLDIRNIRSWFASLDKTTCIKKR